ncbi:hydrogenase expression/formation protein HypE [bacterium]|nr:hydrogenase expression/formation protein HypE [bacterium]MCI0618579.1 hydrogenase expression/formation protein HypE [bacterium]
MKLECPVPIQNYERITLGHGGGGKLSHNLISKLFLPLLSNSYLQELHDGAIFPVNTGRLAFTTDSFVVSPPFFPGGNIGDLSVNGTINDLAMCGARPMYLSLALILEEGFLIKDLFEVIVSISEACEKADVQVITGDLKVVEQGKGDGIFINTTGVGDVLSGIRISPLRIQPRDKIILSGSIAEHGIAILSLREGLSFETALRSDTANLWPLVESILKSAGDAVHGLRDATRGGVASVLNEMAKSAGVGILVDESKIPVREDVQGACEILGLDPLYVANEGKFVAFVDESFADAVLETMHQHKFGENALIIGEVTESHPGLVRLRTVLGGSRVVEMISGEQLPRIC